MEICHDHAKLACSHIRGRLMDKVRKWVVKVTDDPRRPHGGCLGFAGKEVVPVNPQFGKSMYEHWTKHAPPAIVQKMQQKRKITINKNKQLKKRKLDDEPYYC